MLAPANPPRVASNVAPVTRVSVRAARGTPAPLNPNPFNVVRFEDGPDPRIEGPPAVMVTFDIVPAMALRSPAIVGGMLLFTPSNQRSDAPVSGCIGPIGFVARTGRSAVTCVVASLVRSIDSVKLATS